MSPVDPRLEASWLCQLTREYNDICYQYGVRLRPPVLVLSNSRRQLGRWSPADRVLSLSRLLIAGHPWSLTLQVLKHEMAHQLCSEVYGRGDGGHGPPFAEACARLGLDAPFRRATADLAEGLAEVDAGSPVTERGRQIIDRVRKLMALGASANEHEAALAVQRAGEILARHRLDLDALAEDEGMAHRTIATGQQVLPVHRKAICAILEANFTVRVICASLYDPQADRSCKTIELLGRQERVAVAEHCYHFLEDRLQALWTRNRHSFGGNGRTARTSYFLGLLAGFRETLERGCRATENTGAPAETSDLPALREQQRLDDFVTFRYPRLRRLRRQGLNMHGAAYREAVVAGRKITLRPPMGSNGKEVRLLP
ncbi:MAG: DUF2786 domain-containing protein [Desulfobulbus sp.]|jgi:hypothetical protein|nr:DUF2786 domain-containing protein [Desulfobulbus sp.]